MTVIDTTTGGFVDVGETRIWVQENGSGPAVLLIAGLGDPAEAWQLQLDGLADRYRVIAFDNRGAGRTALPEHTPLTLEAMAADAAAVLHALEVPAAHVMGFSGGSAIAQQLTLTHPALVRSLVLVSTWARWDSYARTMLAFWRWMVTAAPSERAMLEAFFLWIYTARAHEDGTVARLIADTLEYPHPQSAEAFLAQLDAFAAHDSTDRLGEIRVPTLVVAGGNDLATPPRFGRAVAEAIAGAEFVELAGEAHQPFQEIPARFNELVDAFWRRVEAAG